MDEYAVVIDVVVETVEEAAPPLHDQTSLEIAANSEYGLTAEETMDASQELYEAELISYPRTSSHYITPDMEQSVSALLSDTAGDSIAGASSPSGSQEDSDIGSSSTLSAKETGNAELSGGNQPINAEGNSNHTAKISPENESRAGFENKNIKGIGGTDSGVPVKYGSPYSQLSPKLKKELLNKVEDRKITKNEYKLLQWDRRFKNRRNRGVKRCWTQERNELLKGGNGTRNWNQQQRSDIINRKTPQFNGKPMEGHHKYNAIDYPQIADDPKNIYLATNNEHFERWHGGNYQNDTCGVPLNPSYPEEF